MKRPFSRSFASWGTSPWTYFILGTFFLGLLSYGSPTPFFRASLIFLTFGLFGLEALREEPTAAIGLNRTLKKDILPFIPSWAWLGLIALGLFLRFWRLDTLSLWPNLDEGRTSWFAFLQSRQWDGKLLVGYNQLPPFFYWMEALYLKIIDPSLFSLWFFPALLSVGILGMGLVTARLFFSRSLSFLAVALLALGFWPLYSGRFAVEGLLVLFWEMAAFMALGFFRLKVSLARAFLLGVVVGSGFYVHLHWPLVAVMVGVAFLRLVPRGHNRGPVLSAGLIPALLIPLPLFLAVLLTPFGDYLRFLTDLPGSNSSFISHLGVAASYLSSLFWGVTLDYFGYKPFWGGLLNPILGGLFFLGLGAWWKNRQQGISLWLLVSFPVFLFPIFLTRDVETFRIIPVLPIVILTAAVGFQSLLRAVKGQRRGIILLLLLAFSLALDCFHLFTVYPSAWADHPEKWAKLFKTHPFYQAFQAWEELPGNPKGALLFSARVAPNDLTLATGTFRRNALWNPRIDPTSIQWVLFFQWEDEDPYLDKRFPDSRSIPLDLWPEDLFQGLQWIHGMKLRVVPMSEKDRAFVESWIKADRCLQNTAIQDLNRPESLHRWKLIEDLRNQRALFEGDPYLMSLWGETLAGYQELERNDLAALASLREVVRLGVPRASTYHRLAVLEVKNAEYRSAYEHFLEAERLNPLFKPPSDLLKKLSEEEKRKSLLSGSEPSP